LHKSIRGRNGNGMVTESMALGMRVLPLSLCFLTALFEQSWFMLFDFFL
jgi:hypothetical protein